MKRYVSRMARKARNAIGAKRRRGVRRRKLTGVSIDMPHGFGMDRIGLHPRRSSYAGVAKNPERLRPRGRIGKRALPYPVRTTKRPRRAAAAGGDMTMSKKTWRPYTGLYLKKVVRNLVKQSYYVVHRLQGVNRMNAVNDGNTLPGYYKLHNTYDVAIGGSMCPLHMFELTGAVQSTTSAEAVGYSMGVTDAGAVTFNTHWCQKADGTTDTNGYWQEERSNASGLGRAAERYWTTHWFDIRLNLYGCNTQPTIYDVMLVQPSEAWAVRESTDTTFTDSRRNFWQGMVKGMTYNPIIPGNNSWLRGCRIIRKWRKIIQPGSPFGSTDVVDKNPFNHVLRIKYYDGKTRDHQYLEASPASDTVALANQWVATDGSNASLRVQPKPRARLYLVVRALNTTPVAEGSATAANTPSYDIIIRRKQSTMLA